MINLEMEDIKFVVRRLPKEVDGVLKEFGKRLCVGGGFIRCCITGESVNDIDMFVDSVETANSVSSFLLFKNRKARRLESKNAITILGYTHPIQIITRWLYDSPTKVLNEFDFSVCCAVVWYDPGLVGTVGRYLTGKCDDQFYQDTAARRLRYLRPVREEDVGGSALRLLKYYRKGYNITLSSYAGVIARLVSKYDGDIKDTHRLEMVLMGLLIEVDPNGVIEDEITREDAADAELATPENPVAPVETPQT